MKPLPPNVTHLKTLEAFALFRDEQTRQNFTVGLSHLTPEGIRAAWHEARSEFYEQHPEQRDVPGAMMLWAIGSFAILLALVGWGAYRIYLFFRL